MSAKQSADEQKKRAAELATESATKKTSPTTSKKTTNTKPASKSTALTAKPTKHKSGWMLALIFLLVLLTTAGTAALGWFGYQQLLTLEQQLAERPTHQELQTPLEKLSAIGAIKERQLLLQEVTSNQQQQLVGMQQLLANSSEPKPRDWQLAEVEYLLRLANQRLQLEEDVEGALTLLKTAEQRLKQANVPGTLGVRAYLLEDIAELKALPKLDRVSMALSLQKLADTALSLKVQSLADAPSMSLEAVIQPVDNLSWYQSLWQEVRSLVVVRKRELPVEALPYTDDELALRHQLSALLLQASWACLRGEEQLYEVSLAGAAKRLQGFDASQPEVEDFTQQLNDLAQQSVSQKLPETETSLDSLQAFIDQRYKLQLPVISEEAISEDKTPEVIIDEEQP